MFTHRQWRSRPLPRRSSMPRSLATEPPHRAHRRACGRQRPEADGTTALHWAAHHGDVELVRRLIRAGAKVDVVNDFGATPMSEAAVLADAVLLGALVEGGASVESPNADGQTALMIVARTSRVDAARVLLQHGANVNAVEKWRGQTALMWAAAQSQPAMVRALIAAGADVNARAMVNNWGRQVTAEPRDLSPCRRVDSAALCGARGVRRLRGGARGRRRGRQPAGSGEHQPAADGGHQHVRRGRGADSTRRTPESHRLLGTRTAVCRR